MAVQPYNALLTLSHLADVSDGLLLLQNEVLHATCTKRMGLARPGFPVGAWRRGTDAAGLRGARMRFRSAAAAVMPLARDQRAA